MLRKLSSTFKVSLAMMFAVLSTGIMPMSASAYAESNDTAANEMAVSNEQHYLQTAANLETCGQVTISLRNVSPWMYRVLIEERVGENEWVRVAADSGNPWMVVPGVMEVNNRGDAPDDQTGTYTVRYAEDSGTKEVRYRVSSGTEGDLYLGLPVGTFTTVPVETNCLPDEPPVELVECTNIETISVTNRNLNGWVPNGDVEFVDGGVKLSVPGNWESSSLTLEIDGELRELGDVINFSPEEQYLGLHVETSLGTLVYEAEESYAGNWWSTSSDFNAPEGMGYPTFDSLENLVANNPDVTFSSITILYTNSDEADVTVSSATIGCVTYVFDYEEAPVTPPEEEEPPVVPPVDEDDEEPVDAPVVPVLGAKTDQPSGPAVTTVYDDTQTLPQTGPEMHMQWLMIVMAGALTYAALYATQTRREYEL